ncbi:MAG: TolC family protein [Gemmatimonadales bacterium]|nr:MAG: TolC family protein [Gemmatimonadales bacterium]
MHLARLLALSVAVPALLGAQEPTTPGITLADAITKAQLAQPSVIAAQGAVERASTQYRTSWGAFIPSLSVSSSYGTSYSNGPSRVNQITGEVISGESYAQSFSNSANASLDLFTGFRRGAQMNSAKATEAAADAGLIDAQYQTALSAKQTFFGALAANELVRVREAGLKRSEEQLSVSVAKLQAGSATRSDSLRSLVTVGNSRLQLLTALTTVATTEANLGRLVGIDGRVRALADSAFLVVTEIGDTAMIRQEAEDNSPKVRAAQAQADAARANVKAAKAAWWPQLTISGRYSYNGNDSQDYQFFDARSMTLALSYPIFNGFQRDQSIVNASTNADAVAATAADARRQVGASLIARLAELDAARLQIEITGTSLVAATEDLRVNQERYRVGAATIVDVLSSQEALSQAEVDVIQARYNYLIAKAQIEALIGRPL